jgi:hypothetical protein
MINFLRCFTCLRKFFYDHGGAIVGYSDFLPQKFGEGLAHLHHCLEELVLLSHDYDDNNGDEPARAIGSLADFQKLRQIVMHAKCLLGPDPEDQDDDDEDGSQHSATQPLLVDILPTSLEALVLMKCDSGILDQLQGLLQQRKEKFSVLKNVAIGIEKPTSGNGANDYRGIEEQLKADYKTTGIELEMIHPGERMDRALVFML